MDAQALLQLAVAAHEILPAGEPCVQTPAPSSGPRRRSLFALESPIRGRACGHSTRDRTGRISSAGTPRPRGSPAVAVDPPLENSRSAFKRDRLHYAKRDSPSIAERLAFAGLDALYLVTDDQLDARRRLGISESDPDVARVQRGSGSVTVVGIAGTHAVDVLYRSGPGRFGKFDTIIVDTPPVKKGGCLPGVLLIAPTDGDDASANLIRMLRATPANTDVVLVRIDAVPRKFPPGNPTAELRPIFF